MDPLAILSCTHSTHNAHLSRVVAPPSSSTLKVEPSRTSDLLLAGLRSAKPSYLQANPDCREQMFTTVASGGWGAPPPRPPCVKKLHQTGFLAESPNFQSSCCACPTKQPQYDRTRAGTGPSQILGGFARVARAEGAREKFSKPEKPENGARKKVYLIPWFSRSSRKKRGS